MSESPVNAGPLPVLPPQAQKVLDPASPAPLRMMAAKAVIPGLKPGDVLLVLTLLATDGDDKVAAQARSTLENLPAPLLRGALGEDLGGAVIDQLARTHYADREVVEKLVRMPRVTREALELLASNADEWTGELIATNEQRLLQYPTVIEKLYMNKRVRMSTADRLLELAVRNNVELGIPAFKEAAAAIAGELVSEPTPEPTYDDVMFMDAERLAAQARLEHEEEDTHETDDEGEEHVRNKFVPLYAQIAQMTVTQKIRRAQLGTAAERLLLVRDTNRLVAVAAVKSPMIREPEVVRVTASRNVHEDVLRTIALNREFTRSYQIKLNLVTNPRTPFSFAARLVPHIREGDLKSLSKSKNISGAIAQAIRQQMSRKSPGGKR